MHKMNRKTIIAVKLAVLITASFVVLFCSFMGLNVNASADIPLYSAEGYSEEDIAAAKAWLSAHGYPPTRAGAEQAYQDYLDGKFDDEFDDGPEIEEYEFEEDEEEDTTEKRHMENDTDETSDEQSTEDVNTDQTYINDSDDNYINDSEKNKSDKDKSDKDKSGKDKTDKDTTNKNDSDNNESDKNTSDKDKSGVKTGTSTDSDKNSSGGSADSKVERIDPNLLLDYSRDSSVEFVDIMIIILLVALVTITIYIIRKNKVSRKKNDNE